MTYTIHPYNGTVTRDSDGHVVAPCQSVEDADFAAYQTWVTDGNEPTLDEYIPPTVPHAVTPRQIRLALNQLGLRDAVEAAVAAGSQNLKDEWQYASEFLIDNPEIVALGAALGADLDALFVLAGTF